MDRESHVASTAQLPRTLNMGVLQAELCPLGVRERLFRSGTTLTTSDQLRDEVRRIMSDRAVAGDMAGE